MFKIRRKTILFLSVTTLAVILCIWGFEYVVSIKKSNAEMIKVLHQQSALSQRISKFIYRIRIDFINDSLAVQKTDSLFVLLSKWKLNHSWLVTNNRKYTGSENVISNCDSLLEKSTSRINGLITVAKKYLANTGEDHIVEAATTVDSLESEYDSFIRQCMDHYEQDESDLASLIYFLPYAIGVFVVFILVIGYLIFVNPLLEEFRKGNADLVDVNSVLAAKTNELYEKLVEINALQESLYVSEKNYRELVENVSDIIYELNDSGKFIFINKGAEQITGFTREEFLQKHFWDIFPPDQSQALVEDLLQLMKSMAPAAYRELPIVSKSNSIIWVGQNITFQYGEGKRLEKVKVVARDITLLREVEQKLKDSESLFRLLSENSTDIICLHEATDDANYIFISPSMKIILGYDPEELIGKSPFSIMLEEDAELIKRTANQKALVGELTSNVEFRMKKKDGTIIWLESWSKSILDKDGVVASFQTATRDISERKVYEQQLKNAKAIAEDALTVKSNFLSIMSHEIRTPLNGVIGLAQLLMRENPRSDQLEHIKLLNFSANNLLVLLNDILDFNKLESGKLNLEFVDFNLKEQLMQVVETFQFRANEKSIDLKLEFGESVPERIIGDPTRFNQIMINLISNALKFTAEGNIIVQVKKLPTGEFEFSVTDTGIGIPVEMQPKIFDSFTQADVSTTRKYGGTGLGLSICKQLVERMGGTMRVKSTVDVGSVFYFVMPLQKADIDQGKKNLEDKPKQFSREYHILVVDDDKINQLVANQFLLGWSLNAKMASSGKEAIEMVDQHSFDLILMDIQMPDMNGFEVTKIIRAKQSNNHHPRIPILAMTAAKPEDIESDSKIAGIDGFVSKPFKADDFFISLYNALETK